MTILAVYSDTPDFPASAQHADARRYFVVGQDVLGEREWPDAIATPDLVVDATGEAPTRAAIDSMVRATPPAPTLDELKGRLRELVDEAAERERLRYITAGAGQALVYEAKRTEVARWRARGEPAEPAPVDFPWAADRATRRDAALVDVLAEWSAQADAWAAIGIAIEHVREAAKEAIAGAADAAAARAIADAIEWPAPPA